MFFQSGLLYHNVLSQRVALSGFIKMFKAGVTYRYMAFILSSNLFLSSDMYDPDCLSFPRNSPVSD